MMKISLWKKKEYLPILIILALLFIGYLLFSYGRNIEGEKHREKVLPLQEGDTIGVLAPAAKGNLADYNRSIELLKDLGYQVKLAPSVTKSEGYLAGSDEDRAKDINDFFKDDTIKAIVCLRGGYGSARILPLLDYKEIAKHPKLFIGFSDITALHAAIGEKSHMVTIHGPMLSSFKNYDYTAYTLYLFENGLSGSYPIGTLPMPKDSPLKTIVPGEASWLLTGGNLSIIASLCGTPYELDGTGALLFLEDTDVDAYEVDRLMEQLYQNGLLSRISGIIYGEFTHPRHGRADWNDFTIDDVLDHYAKLAGKPAIKNFPAGHGEDNLFLPLGIKATLSAKEGESASVTLNESYLKNSKK